MSHAYRIARDDALRDALRAADAVIGDHPATAQARQIIEAIKRLRDGKPVRVDRLEPIDYLTRLQEQAHAAWMRQHSSDKTGILHDATATVDTPLGQLQLTAWRTEWQGGRKAWAGEYALNSEPITIAEIRAAGLAQRATTRARKSHKN